MKQAQEEKRQSRAFLFNQLKEQARIQEAENYMNVHKQVQVLDMDEPSQDSMNFKQSLQIKNMKKSVDPVSTPQPDDLSKIFHSKIQKSKNWYDEVIGNQKDYKNKYQDKYQTKTPYPDLMEPK